MAGKPVELNRCRRASAFLYGVFIREHKRMARQRSGVSVALAVVRAVTMGPWAACWRRRECKSAHATNTQRVARHDEHGARRREVGIG